MKVESQYLKHLFEARPNERILDLPITKLTVKVFLVIFLSTAIPCLWYAIQLPCSLTPKGISYFFLDILKVPLSSLAVFISILGIIGLNHRSEQTKEQIELSRKQSDFSHHFKNQEEFIKHVQTAVPEWVLRQSDIRIFYQNLFPNSEKGDLAPSYTWIEGIYQSLQRAKDITNNPSGRFTDFQRLTSMLTNNIDSVEQRAFNANDRDSKYCNFLMWLNDIFTYNAQTLDEYNRAKDTHRLESLSEASNQQIQPTSH